MRKLSFIIISVYIISVHGCGQNDLEPEQDVYFNDFESEDYTGIEGVFISIFEGNRVIGFFNKRGFNLNLSELPQHNFIRLKFDLNIHDSWEGDANREGESLNDKDTWIVEIDPVKNLKSGSVIYYETSFSNSFCTPGFCYTQSYPDQTPSFNDAQKGASKISFGRCSWPDTPTGTSTYEMDLIFPHKDTNAFLSFYDRLNGSLCDESWSLDNLKISVFK